MSDPIEALRQIRILAQDRIARGDTDGWPLVEELARSSHPDRLEVTLPIDFNNAVGDHVILTRRAIGIDGDEQVDITGVVVDWSSQRAALSQSQEESHE